MKRIKSKIIFGSLLLVLVFIFVYLLTKNDHLGWLFNKNAIQPTNQVFFKTYTNEKFAFSLQYPDTMNIISKDQNPKGSIHEYFYINGEEEFRLHVTPESSYEKDDYYVKSETLGSNIFDVMLFPKGTNMGDFILNEPILYYEIFRNGTRYAFQFNNQRSLTNTQRTILKTLQFE